MKKIIVTALSFACMLIACDKSRDFGLNDQDDEEIVEIQTSKRTGLVLDIARKFYEVETIKKFINTLSDMDAQYLHLHISDNQNYALESTVLGQTKANATFSNGVYVNNNTKRNFLSTEQVKEIVAYAKSKGIEIIPEVDAPGHIKGIIDLLKYKDATLANTVFDSDGQLFYTKEAGVTFIRSVYQEVIEIFGVSNIKRFHIGMDEFAFGGTTWSHEVVQYANDMQKWLKSKGLITQVWNDAVLKKDISSWNKEIEICYWSYDGDVQNPDWKAENRTNRTTVPELAEAGFKVYNCNSYYLYSVPKSDPAQIKHDADYAGLDLLKNWTIEMWDSQDKNAKTSKGNMVGASMAIWGEDSGAATGEQIRVGVETHLRSAILKTKASVDADAQSLVNTYIANNGANFQEILSLKLKK